MELVVAAAPCGTGPSVPSKSFVPQPQPPRLSAIAVVEAIASTVIAQSFFIRTTSVKLASRAASIVSYCFAGLYWTKVLSHMNRFLPTLCLALAACAGAPLLHGNVEEKVHPGMTAGEVEQALGVTSYRKEAHGNGTTSWTYK